MTGPVRRTSFSMIAACMAAIVVMGLPAVAGAAASWQSGPLVESQDFNCVTGDLEQEAGSYLSYYFDPSTPPKAGDVYYVAMDATGIGNTCAGIYADLELSMPSGTQSAISPAHPLRCYLQLPGKSFQQDSSSDCPQTVRTGPYGGFSLDPNSQQYPFWPLPEGGTVELQVPVTSASGANQFHGLASLADGEDNPQIAPTLTTLVNAAAATPTQTISVSYESPSVTGQQQNPTDHSVSFLISGYVWNQDNNGTAVAQFANADAAGDCTAPKTPYYYTTPSAGLQHPDTHIYTPSGSPITGFYPDTAYCWRIDATISGVHYDGNWQFFQTIGQPISGSQPAPTTGTANCSTSGAGCSTSTCATGGSCGTCSSDCTAQLAPATTTTAATPPPPPPPAPPATTDTTPAPAPVPPAAPPFVPGATIASSGAARAIAAGSHVLVRTGLSATCPPAATGACAVSLTGTVTGAQAASAKKTATVGTLKTTVAPGKTSALTLTLSAKGAKLLKRHHKLTIVLKGTTTNGTGATTPVAKTLRVTQPQRGHR